MRTLKARLASLEVLRASPRIPTAEEDDAWALALAERLERDTADRLARGDPDPSPAECERQRRELADLIGRIKAGEA